MTFSMYEMMAHSSITIYLIELSVASYEMKITFPSFHFFHFSLLIEMRDLLEEAIGDDLTTKQGFV